MLALEPGETIALENGIVLHSLSGQNWYYAFSVITGDQFQLNKTSFWVLEAISNGIGWVRLKEGFLTAFEVSAEEGEADLRELLEALYNQKIIRRRNDEE
ncbi:hypothetical protein ACFLVA_00455 [Chloroflexota bacterium]